MKRLFACVFVLIAGCYSDNEAVLEGGKPVELHLKGMQQSLKVAVPEIDGCDYCVVYMEHTVRFLRVFHDSKCRNCDKRSWPDGIQPVAKVDVRDVGTMYITPLKIGDCDYFTVATWGGSEPDDIVHRGRCKSCVKRGLIR